MVPPLHSSSACIAYKVTVSNSIHPANSLEEVNMKHHNARTVLVVLAIITTVLFFVGIIENVPGITGTQVAVIVSVIVALLLLPTAIVLPCLFGTNKLHAFIMKWEDSEDALRQKKEDREHYYQHRRKIREIELEQYRQLLRPRQYRIKRCARYHRHLKRLHKGD